MNAQGNIAYIPRGLTARIAGFHPAGPGSTPGVGKNVLINTLLSVIILIETPTPSWAMYFTLYIKPWFPLKVITVVLASDIGWIPIGWLGTPLPPHRFLPDVGEGEPSSETVPRAFKN